MTTLPDDLKFVSDDPEYFTAAQVRALIAGLQAQIDGLKAENDGLVDTLSSLLDEQNEKQDRKARNLEGRLNKHGEWLDEYDWRIKDVERSANGAPPRRDPIKELPDLNEITKLQAQYFDNSKKKNKRKGEVNHQIKLYVWTCPEEDISKYAHGNHTELYLPLFTPGYKYSRERLGTCLDYLGLGKGDAKFMGCVTVNGRKPDQSAVMYNDYRLKMSIRGEDISFDAPRSKPADAAPDAPLFSWYWRPAGEQVAGDDASRVARPPLSPTEENDSMSERDAV